MLKNFSIYLFGNGFSKFLPFLLLPILTKAMSVSDFGQLIVLHSLFQVFIVVVGFSSNSIVTMYYHGTGDLSSSGGVVYGLAIITINFFLALVLIPVFIFVVALFGFEVQIPLCILLVALLSAFFFQLHTLNIGLYHIEGGASQYVVYSMAHGLLVFGVTYWALISLDSSNTWTSRLFGEAVAAIFLGILALVVFIKMGVNINLQSVNLGTLQLSYQKLIPLVFHSLSVFIIFYIDRLVLDVIIDSYAVGIYAAGFTLAQITFLVVDSKSRVWTVYISKHMETVRASLVVSSGLGYLFFFGVFQIIFNEIISVVTPMVLPVEYVDSMVAVPYLLAGFWFEAAYREVHVWLFVNKKTVSIAGSTIFSAIIHCVLCVILVNKYGVVGAAMAFLLSSFAKFFLVVILLYLHEDIVTPFRNIKRL
jgi:O-antigen/teichoic acid export membrane protein